MIKNHAFTASRNGITSPGAVRGVARPGVRPIGLVVDSVGVAAGPPVATGCRLASPSGRVMPAPVSQQGGGGRCERLSTIVATSWASWSSTVADSAADDIKFNSFDGQTEAVVTHIGPVSRSVEHVPVSTTASSSSTSESSSRRLGPLPPRWRVGTPRIRWRTSHGSPGTSSANVSPSPNWTGRSLIQTVGCLVSGLGDTAT